MMELACDVLEGKRISQATETLEGTLMTKTNLKSYAEYPAGTGDSADVPPSFR
jgi:hypothetical protein